MNYTERPKILDGYTERINTGCGYLYVTVNSLNGTVIEIFASLGKSGGCSKCYAEALTKAITVGLRSGVELQRYYKILNGVRCNNVTYSDGVQVLSCSDAIAIIIKRHLDNETVQTEMPLMKNGVKS
jgi:ribonucleoside-diphosphate reductase alpha chain